MTSNSTSDAPAPTTTIGNTTNEAVSTVEAEVVNRGASSPNESTAPNEALDDYKSRSDNEDPTNHDLTTSDTGNPRFPDAQIIAPVNRAAVYDSALAFLATATPEKLVGIFTVLIIATYILLGRLGLILIGTILGVVLHASWEGGGLDARRKQTEGSVELAGRLLDWDPRENKPGKTNVTNSGDIEYYVDLPPIIADALASFADGVIEAHVKRWYDNMLPHEPTFPNACRGSLTHFMGGISSNLSRRKPTDIFIQFLTNVSSILIVFLGEISAAIQLQQQQQQQPQSRAPDESKDSSGSSKPTSTAEAIHAYLAQYPESSLASVISTSQQNKKLHTVAQDFLQTFLESNVANCDPMMTFLRELFAGVILQNVLNKTTKADYINNWIIYLLEAGETDLMHAIDAGVDGGGKRHSRATKSTRETEPRNSPSRRRAGGNKKRHPHVSRSDMDMKDALEEVRQLNAMIAAAEAEAAAEAASRGKTTFQSADLGDGGHVENIESTDSHHERKGSTDVDPAKSSDWEKPQLEGRQSFPTDLGTAMTSNGRKNQDKDLPKPPMSPPDTNATMNRSTSVPLRNHGHDASLTLTSTTPQPRTSVSHVSTPLQKTVSQSRGRSPDQPSSKFLNASVTLMDDTLPNDRTKLRSKPVQDYLLQIETRPDTTANIPASGYVITRRYTDFEALHETLKRIASVSGYNEFTLKHNDLPFWKGQTGNELREALERYLNDALKYIGLADCEKMKKYLEKDASVAKTKTKFSGFPTPKNEKGKRHNSKGITTGSDNTNSAGSSSGNLFENMGKGMLEVLTHAPRDMTKGGKTMLDNVASAFQTNGNSNSNDPGNVNNNTCEDESDSVKQNTNSDFEAPPVPFPQTPTRTVTDTALGSETTSNRLRAQSDVSSPKDIFVEKKPAPENAAPRGRLSMQVQRSMSASTFSGSPAKHSSERSRLSLQLPANPVTPESGVGHPSGTSHRVSEAMKEDKAAIEEERSMVNMPTTNAADEKTQDENQNIDAAPASVSTSKSSMDEQDHDLSASPEQYEHDSQSSPDANDDTSPDSTILTGEETNIAIELLFAIINETYTLSSAWSLRKKLLTAAKSILLRSGNPGAEAMRIYLQDKILRANASQEAIIGHIGSLKRAATGPGGSHFPEVTSAKERDELRHRARRIFVTRGMPQALMGVMGSSATEEALGRIFDCLQMEEVARGLMFTIMLQGLKTIIM